MSEVDTGPDKPMHMLKLACVKYLGMSSSITYSVSISTADSSHWQAFYNDFPDICKLFLGLLPEKNTKHEITL